MKIDIIIPTYKPDETFCLLLQKLQRQTFVVHRVIILNTEKTFWEKADAQYGLEEHLSQLPFEHEVIHITKEEFDHAGTRMAGAMHSDADIMIFMTQDAMPADEYLVENLISAFVDDSNEVKESTAFTDSDNDNENSKENNAVAVAYARQLPNKDCRIVEQYTRKFNYPEEDIVKSKANIPKMGIKTFFCSDVCAAYRRDIFLELGGFETPMIFGEDMYYAAKAINHDYKVAYKAAAKVVHSHNYSMGQQFHRNFDVAVFQKQHPEIFENISSEAEGMKLVKSTVKYLFSIRKPWLIADFGFQCVGKYAGFLLGKRYQKLSRKQILWCSMNPDYWKKTWTQK